MFTHNKRKKAATPVAINPLKIDPTRSITLRRSFSQWLTNIFGELKREIVSLIVDEDAFGLKKNVIPVWNQEYAEDEDWEGETQYPNPLNLMLNQYETMDWETRSSILATMAINVFCPTGAGGGIDPTCSPGQSSGASISAVNEALPTREQWKNELKHLFGKHWKDTSFGPDDFEESCAGGLCIPATVHLQKKLQEKGIETKTVYGDYREPGAAVHGPQEHQWLVTHTGIVIDPTEVQFVSDMQIGDIGVYGPTDKRAERYKQHTHNSFCSTGPGGGVDPTCSPGETGGGSHTKDAAIKAVDKAPVVSANELTPGAARPGVLTRGNLMRNPLPHDISEKTHKKVKEVMNDPHVMRSTKEVEIGSLVSTQSVVNKDSVKHFIKTDDRKEQNHELPVVVKVGKKLYLFDGNHRTAGDLLAGRKTTKAVVYEKAKKKATHNSSPEAHNVFCATGPGGGVDPTCSPGGGVGETHSHLGKLLKKSGSDMSFTKYQQDSYLKAANYLGTHGALAQQSQEMTIVGERHKEGMIEVTYKPGKKYISADHTKLKAWADQEGIEVVGGPGSRSGVKVYLTPRTVHERLESARAIDYRPTEMIPEDFHTHAALNTRWKYKSQSEAAEQFDQWLKGKLSIGPLSEPQKEKWKAFIQKGFEKGASRAFDDTTAARKKSALDSLRGVGFVEGRREQFIRQSISTATASEKLRLLEQRALSELKGMTEEIRTKAKRTIIDGLVRGQNPKEIAAKLQTVLDVSKGRAETIAYTELVRAHADGQLEAMEQLGVAEVGVAVEWNAREGACPMCTPMEGVVLSIGEAKGMIPRHPRCMCAFVPANIGEDKSEKKAQKRGKYKITKAITQSQKRQFKSTGEVSDWGPNKPITKKRPESTVFNQAVYKFEELLGVPQ